MPENERVLERVSVEEEKARSLMFPRQILGQIKLLNTTIEEDSFPSPMNGTLWISYVFSNSASYRCLLTMVLDLQARRKQQRFSHAKADQHSAAALDPLQEVT